MFALLERSCSEESQKTEGTNHHQYNVDSPDGVVRLHCKHLLLLLPDVAKMDILRRLNLDKLLLHPK